MVSFDSSAEVTVSLRQTTYSQDEGNGDVLVCADLSGISARDVIVNLSTTDGSAIGLKLLQNVL